MAAGRKITVEFLGNNRDLDRAMDQSASRAGRFGTALKKAGKVAALGLAAGALIAGKALFEMTKAAVADEAAQAKLANTLKKAAGATDAQIAQTEEWISTQGQLLGVTDDELRPALAKLATATGDVEEAQRLASLAMDVAAGSGKSLDTVTTALQKAQNGSVGGLSRLGVATKNAAGETLSFEQIQKNLAKVHQGAAATSADTLEGKMNRLKVQLSEAAEAIGSKLIPVVSDMVEWFTDEGLPAAQEFGDALRDKVGKVVGPLADKLAAAKKSAQRLADSLKAIDLDNLDSKKLGETLGKALAKAVTKFISLSGTVTKSLGKMFGKVDWVGLGITIGKQVPALLLGLTAGILNFDFESIFQGVKDHWGDILLAVLTIAFAPAKIAGGLAKLLAKIPFVGTFLARSVTWLNELGGKLVSFGGDLLKALWRGFTGGRALPGAGLIVKVLAALKGLPGKVRDFMVSLQVRLGVWALDAFEAIGKGAGRALVGLLRFVGSIPGRILSALGSLLRLLTPKGADLMEGFLRAIRDKAGSVFDYVKAIPSRIKDAFGAAGSLLKTIGGQIIGGLVSGIQAAAYKVLNAVQDLINKIPKKIRDLMGISSPSKVTDYLGRMIGEGLARGIDTGGKKAEEALKKRLDKLKDQLSAAKDLFKGLKESVAGSFTSGLFDAETASDFIASLSSTKGTLGALKEAFKTLTGWGLKPGFLAQLFQSGNAGLILDLAKNKDSAVEAGSLFGGITTASGELGGMVAGAEYGDEIKALQDKIKKLEGGPAKGRVGDTYNLNVSMGLVTDPVAAGREMVKAFRQLERATGRQFLVSAG